PDSIITDLSNNVYNTATKVNFNVYAVYGSRKENITDSVLIHPYDDTFIKIVGNSITFKNAGMQHLTLEYEGVKTETKISAINAVGFNYITDKKPNNPVNVKIFDKYIDFEIIKQWPYIEDGRTLVPLRAVFEVLNCEINWDATSRSAILQQGNTKIVVTANSKNIYVNGTNITLDVPARIVNDRIMVPLRFIGETLNKTVIWDSQNSTVIIY
ncbi:MAG: copper amine oxidase N-terminal domain-containing protein, partial [Tissierellia bacterium]|nr:copper amine oxidase N-terminal domain-containing protein [Tissierellia bacterium]